MSPILRAGGGWGVLVNPVGLGAIPFRVQFQPTYWAWGLFAATSLVAKMEVNSFEESLASISFIPSYFTTFRLIMVGWVILFVP